MTKNAEYWIKKLGLSKHPEGGYFKEIYRSDDILKENFLADRYKGNRSVSTSIYFLLKSSEFSAFHRLKSDEIWHYYQGSALSLYIIDDKGILTEKKLGPDPENNESFQIIINAGSWFGAKVFDNSDNNDSFTLIGCTVAPGFDFKDFELGQRDKLISLFPKHKKIIKELTLK
jgi:predicted cupin superfamily sugar epimerase